MKQWHGIYAETGLDPLDYSSYHPSTLVPSYQDTTL